MKLIVESLRRLYAAGKVTYEKINSLRCKGVITEDEMQYILQN